MVRPDGDADTYCISCRQICIGAPACIGRPARQQTAIIRQVSAAESRFSSQSVRDVMVEVMGDVTPSTVWLQLQVPSVTCKFDTRAMYAATIRQLAGAAACRQANLEMSSAARRRARLRCCKAAGCSDRHPDRQRHCSLGTPALHNSDPVL